MKSEFSLSNLISREFRMCSSPSLCKPYVCVTGRLLGFFHEVQKIEIEKSWCFCKCGICSSVFSLACYFSWIGFSKLRLTNRLGVFCVQRIVFRSCEIYKYDWHFLSFFRRKSRSLEWSQQCDCTTCVMQGHVLFLNIREWSLQISSVSTVLKSSGYIAF